MKKIMLLGILLLFLLTLTVNAFAERVGPVRIYLTCQKGKPEMAIISLRGVVPSEKVFLFKTDIVTDRNGNYVFERQPEWKYSAYDWAKLYKLTVAESREIKDPMAVVLNPKKEEVDPGPERRILSAVEYQEKEVITLGKERTTYMGVKVKVPYNVKPGEYYFAIMEEPSEFSEIRGIVDGKAVSVKKKTRIAIPVVITVPGAVAKKTGEIVKNSLIVDVANNGIKVRATFSNTGNCIENVNCLATIVGEKGKVYAKFVLKAMNPALPDGTGEVFPETLRDFEGFVNRPLPPGETLTVKVIFNYGVKYRKLKTEKSFSVSGEIAKSQAELLTLACDKEVLKIPIKPGQTVMEKIILSNLDFAPLSVAIETSDVPWLEFKKDTLNIREGQELSLNITARLTKEETAEAKNALITFCPKTGKPVTVTIMLIDAMIEDDKEDVK